MSTSSVNTGLDTGERYNLRWNNFLNNLVQVFSDLKHKEQLVDVTLVCEGHHIKAHKIVLAACSDFFMELFKNINHTHPVIKFYDMQLTNFKHVIQFIYQGEVKVLDADLESVLNLGEKFQVKGLSSVKLKHQVGPTGECIAPESVKYKVLPQRCFNTETITTNNILNSNVSVSELVDNTSEPVKKKAKIPGINDISSNIVMQNKSVEKSQVVNNSFTGTSASSPDKCISLSKNNSQSCSQYDQPLHSNQLSPNIKNYSKVTNKEQNKEISEPQQQNTALNQEEPKEVPELYTTDTIKDGTDKPNAFIIFSREWRKKLKVEYPSEDFKSISVRLSNLWKSLTSETKESYYTAARQAQLSIPHPKLDT